MRVGYDLDVEVEGSNLRITQNKDRPLYTGSVLVQRADLQDSALAVLMNAIVADVGMEEGVKICIQGLAAMMEGDDSDAAG